MMKRPDNLTCQERELRRLNGPKTDKDVEARCESWLLNQPLLISARGAYLAGHAAGRAEGEDDLMHKVEKRNDTIGMLVEALETAAFHHPNCPWWNSGGCMCANTRVVTALSRYKKETPPAQEGEE